MVSARTLLPENAIGREDIEHWLAAIGEEFPGDIEALKTALDLAWTCRGQELDAFGNQRMHRLLSVAEILLWLELDAATIIAAILQDTSECTDDTLREAIAGLGDDVAAMVDDLGRIGALTRFGAIEKVDADSSENLRRLLLSIADDVRVIIIVLARRLYQMRRLKHQPDAVRRDFARITLDIHAPLANRLGIWQLKWELEDLGFRYLEPEKYKEIAGLLESRREERERYVAEVMEELGERLAAMHIHAQVMGRPKHIYSIWKKMQRKGIDFQQVFDVLAVRILVDSIPHCYAALGIVHGRWKHIPGEFDDYIATPKGNNYQSLHTVVIGPGNVPVEIQVRTEAMHAHAELGVAAHWRYKEGGEGNADLERRILWMRQWLEQKADDNAESEAIEQEFEAANVYVLTPASEVIELPAGATPIDFAYAIHTSVGHRCRGARINGRIAPLTQPLHSGDSVEIITAREGGPGRDWLNAHAGYIRTARARNRVRQWFRQQNHAEHVAIGKASLEHEQSRLGLPRPNLERIAKRNNLNTAEDVLAAIGRGDLSPIQVLGGGQKPVVRQGGEAERPGASSTRVRAARKRRRAGGELIVEGVDDLLTHIAGCCKPVPQDPVVGFITRGHGVTVHRQNCPVVKKLRAQAPERLVDVSWAESAPENALYSVDIQVIAADRKGLLRDLSTVFANAEIDVLGVKSHSNRKTDTASMRFSVEIHDIAQLGRVLDRLAQLPDVIEVRRKV